MQTSQTKHFAFLIDCPSKGKYMMFPDYYENLSEEELSLYDIEDIRLEDLRWEARLTQIPYKVLRKKPKQK